MKKSVVAIVKTSPATVLADYHRVMNLAGYQECISKDLDTALKINISWHFFYPGSSTTPWQLDGVIRAMKRDGYRTANMHGCHNRTVVIDAHLGERENKQLAVIENHGLRNIHLYEGEEWINVHDAVGDLTKDFLCLNKVYPRGFLIPKRFVGENIIHLPTIKTHVFTTTTGAMKNAFGGLLNEYRHWTHPVIHETLVDMLMIQKKIHPGLFAVMDGTFAGDGPGPRCMVPYVKNVLLASADQVAIDAIAAKLMGFDPLRDIKFIRLAHERGLGCGDPREIEIVGDPDAAEENWGFAGPFRKMTFASSMQHAIYWGPLKKPLEWSLKTFLAPWSYIASVLFHDLYWYPAHKQRVLDILHSVWGRLFQNWEKLRLPPNDIVSPGWKEVGDEPPKLHRETLKYMLIAMKTLGSCIKDAPEFKKKNDGSTKQKTTGGRGDKKFHRVSRFCHTVSPSLCLPVNNVPMKQIPLTTWLKALRPHQWVKNLLVFAPILLAHEFRAGEKFHILAIAFVLMCGVASAIYIINDIFDKEADRLHPNKKNRPFASGALASGSGIAASALMLAIAFSFSIIEMPGSFTLMLVAYGLLSFAYSLIIKKILMADVIALSFFYTLRILAGGVAVDIPVSPWLLAFSWFFFLGLSFVKRYGELLQCVPQASERQTRRSYVSEDRTIVLASGIASGFISVLVFLLYVTTSEQVNALYRNTLWLWVVAPLLIYWQTRVWFLVHRNKLGSDPVSFALRDPVSWIVAAAIGGLMVAGTVS